MGVEHCDKCKEWHDPRVDCPKKSVDEITATLNERNSRYGDYQDNANNYEAVMEIFMECAGWKRMRPVFRYAIRNIVQKLVRIIDGDHEYKDNWHDIQGNAKCAEEKCR